MNGYKAFYNGKQCEIWAETLLKARDKAVKHWHVPAKKEHMVSVVLCEKDGTVTQHSTAEFG